jgi:hypothetical protein
METMALSGISRLSAPVALSKCDVGAFAYDATFT